MSKPFQADWQLIQTLYVQGLTPRAIAERINDPKISKELIQTRSKRGNWMRLRTATLSTSIQPAKVALSDEREAIANLSKQARNALAAEVIDSTHHLATLKRSKSLESTYTRSQIARTTAETAKTVFGWDSDSAKSTVINVAVLESLPDPRQEQGNAIGQGQTPTIDVECTTPETSQSVVPKHDTE